MEKIKKTNTDFMKLGMTSMVGLGAMGTISTLPGMPPQAAGLMPIAGAGAQIGMMGGLLNVSQSILPDATTTNKKKKVKDNKKNDVVSKILG